MDRLVILLGADMIGVLARAWDNLLGRGEAAVTVPPLDGALRPNRLLDEARTRLPLEGVDCLAVASGRIVASAGKALFELSADAGWQARGRYEADIAAIAALGADGLAVALASGDILIEGGRFDGRRVGVAAVSCITALAAQGTDLFVANGSAVHSGADWQRDLMMRNSSGSIWRIDLETGQASLVADGLGWPAGLVADEEGLVFSEAWKHRLVRIGLSGTPRPQHLVADFPGYPGRISKGSDGYWLAVFAPRSQLVEFVLREPAYRKRMIAEVPREFWIAPAMRSGRSFYEPLQGGGVKHLGMLKPWAPTMSAGLCVRLDAGLRLQSSLHSRADGSTHGVTSAVEHEGRVFVAARGDGVVVRLDAGEQGGEA